jgi:hypothetical protein
MTRDALEHLLRAAAALTNERHFVVIGSQAVLGQFPSAPDAARTGGEASILRLRWGSRIVLSAAGAPRPPWRGRYFPGAGQVASTCLNVFTFRRMSAAFAAGASGLAPGAP